MRQSFWGTPTAQLRMSPSSGAPSFVLLQVSPSAVLPLPRLTLTGPLFTTPPLISELSATGPLLPFTGALVELVGALFAFTGALIVLASADGTHMIIIPAVAAAMAKKRFFPDIFGFLYFLGMILGT